MAESAPQDAPRPRRGGRRPASPRQRRPARRRNPAATAAAAAEAPAITLSAEAVLWGTLAVAAFALRLARLESPPLTLAESARAFASFLVAQGSVPEDWTGDLTAVLTALVFRLFGEGELGARIVPALAGGATVAAVWPFSRLVGRGAALAAAALLALSPLAVLAARSGLAYSLGALLSLTMVLSLFAYLREQRLRHLIPLATALALAPTVDAVATATALAVAAFLLFQGFLLSEKNVTGAFQRFLSNPTHWQAAALIAAAALVLGLTHYGTSLDRLGLAGLTQWGDMFATPGDGRPWHYQVALLVGYEWPLALLGLAAFGLGLFRLLRSERPISLFQRFLLFWTAVALATVALATRREGAQMLILLLPLALLAGPLLEEIVSRLNWSALRRYWLPTLLALLLIAYAALLLTEWFQGKTTASERVALVLALAATAGIVAGAYQPLGRDGTAVVLAVVGVVAAAFLVHSSLAVVLNDGPEYALDMRADPTVEGLPAAVAQARGEGEGIVVIDPALREPLAWYLRDQPIAFGDPGPGTAVYIGPPEAAREGFAPQSPRWTVARGWNPPGLPIVPMWGWLLFRETFGNLSTIEAQLYLPQP